MTAIKRFAAHTLKVSAPNLVDVSLRLDFGVLLERQVRIANAPPTDSLGAMYNAALQCLIVLCGGKSLVVDLDPSQRNYEVDGVVAVASKLVPVACVFGHTDGTRLLDIGAYLHVLCEHGYDKRVLLAALNGKPWPTLRGHAQTIDESEARRADTESHSCSARAVIP